MRAAFIFAPILLLAACDGIDATEAAKSPGPDATRSFAAGPFTGVDLHGPDKVVVQTGGASSVTAKGQQATLDQLDIRIQSGVLRISRKSGYVSTSGRGATVTVTVPQLSTATISGAGDLEIDKVGGQAFSLSLTGAGDVDIASLTSKTVEMALRGAGDVTAAGKVDRATVKLLGVGSIDIGKLAARDLAVVLKGAGSVEASATGTATIDASGVGSVDVSGGAKCIIVRRGLGSVDCNERS